MLVLLLLTWSCVLVRRRRTRIRRRRKHNTLRWVWRRRRWRSITPLSAGCGGGGGGGRCDVWGGQEGWIYTKDARSKELELNIKTLLQVYKRLLNGYTSVQACLKGYQRVYRCTSVFTGVQAPLSMLPHAIKNIPMFMM
jgi:hypothetical protein